MKKLLLLSLFLFSCLMQAQGATIGPASCGPTTISPGQTVSCTAVLAGAGTQISGCQGTVVTSSPVGQVIVSVAGTASTATKTSSSVGNNWLVSGLNANPISDGVLINFSFASLASTPGGTFAISLSGLACTTPAGVLVVTTANPPQSISVSGGVSVNVCDLNGDGLVNSLDYDKARSNLLSRPQVPNFPPAPPTISDVQIVANAVNGGSCTITPPPPPILTLVSLVCAPQTISTVTGGTSQCTVTTSTAPTGGISVSLSTTADISIPTAITVPQGASSASFTVVISAGFGARPAPITATYNGVSKTSPFAIQ